jgi:hypothetical protein
MTAMVALSPHQLGRDDKHLDVHAFTGSPPARPRTGLTFTPRGLEF